MSARGELLKNLTMSLQLSVDYKPRANGGPEMGNTTISVHLRLLLTLIMKILMMIMKIMIMMMMMI